MLAATAPTIQFSLRHLLFFFLVMSAATAAYSQNSKESIQETIRTDSISTATVKHEDPEYSPQQLRDKLTGYTRMYRNGKILFTIGLPLSIIGLFSYAGSALALSEGNQIVGVPLAVVAVVGVGFGPEMAIVGGVLKRVGGNKKREYEKRMSFTIGFSSFSMNYLF